MELVVYGTFLALSLVAYYTRNLATKSEEKKVSVSNVTFKSFQKSFFFVYFLALLGDWLQGPYVYKLYAYYGFQEAEIAVLYLAGFASSVVFGTCTGPLADIFGRKKVAVSFAVIYTFCCLTKLSSNFTTLFVGRIFGGIATSMLFSTFESWYVYEHSERHGFPAEWIGLTFSITTFWNGLIAIFAGIISNVGAETLGFGPVAPFVVALVPLVLCGVIILSGWNENYGSRHNDFSSSCMEGARIIFNSQSIFLLGTIQSLLESCMYIFVFLWTPVLDNGSTPLGMVFSCFMVCIMVGSNVFTLLTTRGFSEQYILKLCLYLIAGSMGVCCLTAGPEKNSLLTGVSFISFLVLEVGIGMYFPSISFLRSQVIPESHRANVMNWFRVPMNCMTCGALLCLRVKAISDDKRVVFAFCLLLSVLGIVLCKRFINILDKSSLEGKQDLEEEKDESKTGLLKEIQESS